MLIRPSAGCGAARGEELSAGGGAATAQTEFQRESAVGKRTHSHPFQPTCVLPFL